jgi:peptidyl-prolyl cis-trans isomerase C
MKTTVVALSLALASSAFAQNIAVVNGKPIPTSRMASLERQVKASGQEINDDIKNKIKDELITREIFVQEALARGLNQSAEYKDQMELARSGLLIRALVADEQAKRPITPDSVKAEYDRVSASMNTQEYNASHILVEDEAAAKDLIAKINGGADFAELAKQHSKDPGSGANGGELSWASPDSYVPEFSAAMVKLAKGEVTAAPVQSQFGWHIIRLNDSRKAALPPFDQVKDAVEKSLRERQMAEFQAKLRSAAKIQ